MLQPQFAGFTDERVGSGTPSITSLGGGARFSLNDEETEVYFGARAATTGRPAGRSHDNGDGFDINGGFNYEFWRGTGARPLRALRPGVDRRDAEPTATTKFLTTGLEVPHRFLPPPPPPPPAPAVAARPPPPPPVKKKIVLRGVNFDFDKSNIRPDAMPILDEAAKTLKERATSPSRSNGYTDSIGSDAYNQRLSERRANAVQGVPRAPWRRGEPHDRARLRQDEPGGQQRHRRGPRPEPPRRADRRISS